ncbi:pyridoxal-phosphate dependent enzyme [Falsihalocynthiibacter sp. S25ZX9]|uniref:pyridoxal-phosphate dependent enzyme n=1 Tax=Falsihalocynthiibacter sp. S25ZX9 TaxID=3240870 RepID=UPI00350F2100
MKHSTFALCPASPSHLLKHWPAYAPSPLVRAHLSQKPLLLKDETSRMGLGSFKALGGAYAVARLIMGDEEYWGRPLADFHAKAKGMTFICASAGNHGISVAAGAQLFGAKARIHLSTLVPAAFAVRLKSLGAQVVISGETYEQSVQSAIEEAARGDGIHLADGSWEGYTEPPRLVMEGYTIIAEEMRAEFEEKDDWPSHVFLQAGVGGMAGAITYMIRKNWSVQPHITVVEPNRAPCLRDSVEAGRLVEVSGPVSNMGRLDCKTASMLGFEILREKADHFTTITDAQAQSAVNDLCAYNLYSTPSGAAGFAAVEQAKLGKNARALVLITEGVLS